MIAPESVVELFTMRVTARFAITTLLLLVAGWIAAQSRKTALEEGVERFQRRDFPGAVQAFLKATQEQPSDTRALTYLGMSYAAEEDYKSALDPLRRACQLRPAEENACYFLGRTCYSLNRFEEAVGAFHAALLNAGRPGRTSNGMALALEALGKDAEAERFYQDAIRLKEQRALVDYGMFLYKHGRGTESIEMLRRANAHPELDRVTAALAHAPAANVRSQRAFASPVRGESAEHDLEEWR